MTLRPSIIASVVLAFGLFIGCNEEFNLDRLAGARGPVDNSDTSYVEIFPPFSGFEGPGAICIGNDQILYVADTKANRVVMMNLAGTVLGQRSIDRPVAIAQDLRLDLLIGGVVVSSVNDTMGAVFRIRLVPSQHRLEEAEVDTVWTEPARPRRRFVGIGVLPDNQYLVLRKGPDNSSFIDPDSRLLRFSARDEFITPVADLRTRAGTGITDIYQPTSIGMFPNSKDFILLQSSEGVAYGAIWMAYSTQADFEGWMPKYDPALPEQRFVDFVRPNRFLQPSGVGIDGKRRDVFIADAAQDSIMKFDSKGVFRKESFGYAKTQGRMKHPTGVAFTDRTMYVTDDSVACIFRFRLSTDVQ
jgi:hypothetical protein